MVIKELLEIGNRILKENNIDEYFFKTRMLLSKLLGKEKEYLITYQDEVVDFNIEKEFFSQINLLKNNIPIQYIIHEQEFMGNKFYVDENVLIPQPDTEILVEEMLEKIKTNDKILDLCTGSGAIGISIAKKRRDVIVDISDISESALDVAKRNIKSNDVNVNVILSNLFENISNKYNMIVSNPPYIETDVISTLSFEVQNEPTIALDGGKDGLDFYRNIAKQANKFLEDGGILAFEIGYNQKEAVMEIMKDNKYKEIYCKKDYGNNDRIIIGVKGE